MEKKRFAYVDRIFSVKLTGYISIIEYIEHILCHYVNVFGCLSTIFINLNFELDTLPAVAFLFQSQLWLGDHHNRDQQD